MQYGKMTGGLLLGGALLLGAAAACPAAPVQEESLAQTLEALFKAHPELVMRVLKEHSEEVLDIAQDGAEVKRARLLREQWKNDLNQPKDVSLNGRAVRGAKNAPVTIVAFSDFTCAYCYKSTKTIQLMLKKYEGKVRFVFKHMPLRKDDIGWRASEYFIAASMQNPDKAWRLHDRLFEGRDALMGEKGEEFLKKAAKNSYLDMKRLEQDLSSETVSRILEEDLEESKKLEIQGTPYFLVNNLVIRGALAPELFDEAVRMALKNAN